MNECPGESVIQEDSNPKLPVEMAIYVGSLYDKYVEEFLEWCRKGIKYQADCSIALVTDGGSAETAYRISKALQRKYSKVNIVIPGICKSAGTLLCIGANSLTFGKDGELGPLDVQELQKDELMSFSSGLTPSYALSVLRAEGFMLFENTFLSILERSQGRISTGRAASIATELTSSLLKEVYAQLDPIQVGQTARNMTIALEYGERLNAKFKNFRSDALTILSNTYPSHEFVIDIDEAKELCYRVDSLAEEQEQFLAPIFQQGYSAWQSGKSFFCVLLKEEPVGEDKQDGEKDRATDPNNENESCCQADDNPGCGDAGSSCSADTAPSNNQNTA